MNIFASNDLCEEEERLRTFLEKYLKDSEHYDELKSLLDDAKKLIKIGMKMEENNEHDNSFNILLKSINERLVSSMRNVDLTNLKELSYNCIPKKIIMCQHSDSNQKSLYELLYNNKIKCKKCGVYQLVRYMYEKIGNDEVYLLKLFCGLCASETI